MVLSNDGGGGSVSLVDDLVERLHQFDDPLQATFWTLADLGETIAQTQGTFSAEA